ncbi:MAG: tRNA 2-thiouridine(34) synthase MnmA, partial [Candidatus Magasanikbacteria bacterium]|nr:tRNA 2-thiouridine(34) synthase MnmA [Candidatus Magasanikbacteria bacterium]
VVTMRGRVIGKHKGLAYYTIGQREGVGVSQKIPHYVVSKDKPTNTIIAAPFNDEIHYKVGIQVEKVNWVGLKPKVGENIQARIRYRQPLFGAKIKKLSGKSTEIEFLDPQKAVTPGQAAVFYKDKLVLGGGTII